MTRTFLIASVAAFAILAPAQAERGGRGGNDSERGQKAEKAQQSEARGGGGGQRAERPQHQQRQQRMEQSDRGQRFERPQRQERAERPQRQMEQRSQRQFESRGRDRQVEMQRAERQRAERRSNEMNRARAQERQRAERRSNEINRARAEERQRAQRVERASRQVENRQRAEERRIQAERRDSRRMQAQDRQQQRFSSRELRREQQQRNAAERFDRRTAEREFDQPRVSSQQFAAVQQQSWQNRANRIALLTDRREHVRDINRVRFDDNDDQGDNNDDQGYSLFRVGERVNPNWWASDYVPLRYRTRYVDNDDYYYRYDGDWLYRLDDDDDIVLGYYPLLGGALSVGRPLPYYYDSYYNVPMGYSSLYYDTPDYYYRYGDGAIYQVNPATQLIAGIVALVTGNNLRIGQMLPTAYNTYNVPLAYRDQYYDTNDMWWRYNDGYMYGVDPYNRMIETMVPVYDGYAVGQPWPTYAGYDYGVPGYYDDLYYAQPGYDYRYASGGIYQVDPATQMVASLVALVTGQNFAVGQQLPMSYGVYNVPLAYRDQYYDTNDMWYRYADGRILAVDPGTRMINRIIVV